MNPLKRWHRVLQEHLWLAFVLPMVVFMLIGSLEPKPNTTSWPNIPYSAYPWVYALKLIATIVCLVLVWPNYLPLRMPIGWKGVLVGILGAILWIGLCHLRLEQSFLRPMLESIGLDSFIGSGERSAFNPFVEFSENRPAAIAYLLVRGVGLVLVVPIMEEFFLRGFVMRYFASENWSNYPIGQVTFLSAVLGTALPMLMHPGELLAAAVWFSMISVLAWYTKNIWECVAAHATTNLLLGVYVLTFGAWHLV